MSQRISAVLQGESGALSDPEARSRCSSVQRDSHTGPTITNLRSGAGQSCGHRPRIGSVATFALLFGLLLAGCGAGKHAVHVPTASITSITTALVSRNPQALKPLLAPVVQKNLAGALLPAGTTMKVVPGKDEVSGDVARVPVVLSGPLKGDWFLLLVKSGGQWRLYGTAKR